MVSYNWVIATEWWRTHFMSFFTNKICSVFPVKCDSHRMKGSYYFPYSCLTQRAKSKIVIFKNRFFYGGTCLKSGGKHSSSQRISLSEKQGYFLTAVICWFLMFVLLTMFKMVNTRRISSFTLSEWHHLGNFPLNETSCKKLLFSACQPYLDT